mmetsp:Transcript_9870/g.23300  ORF Transcript_9870/g.23300 Transcript_9870/m.23300 type:complete len:242 (-) Transcript_9870:1023-1748(-)
MGSQNARDSMSRCQIFALLDCKDTLMDSSPLGPFFVTKLHHSCRLDLQRSRWWFGFVDHGHVTMRLWHSWLGIWNATRGYLGLTIAHPGCWIVPTRHWSNGNLGGGRRFGILVLHGLSTTGHLSSIFNSATRKPSRQCSLHELRSNLTSGRLDGRPNGLGQSILGFGAESDFGGLVHGWFWCLSLYLIGIICSSLGCLLCCHSLLRRQLLGLLCIGRCVLLRISLRRSSNLHRSSSWCSTH